MITNKQLDELNFSRLVEYYREELEAINNGMRAREKLSIFETNRLTKLKLLDLQRNGKGSSHKVSPEALKILNGEI